MGPFVLTFLVVVFILLMQHMLKYFDDIIGKDLGWDVLGTLLFYFAVFMTPVALPLAVLLSSLITFGNLGEHFELTAIKSLGVSLTRALIPISLLVVVITGCAFLANNYLVPKAALEAYSLLYDIKQKKPSLDLKEGSFYGAIPDVNIKVNKKYPDGVTLEGVVIYDHRGRTGNRDVTIADSGRMYTILGSRYLKLELFRGYNYSEGSNAEASMTGQSRSSDTFSKTKFEKTFVVFDLSAFMLERTDKKWFQGNRIMRNLVELNLDMDSVAEAMKSSKESMFTTVASTSGSLAKSFNLELPPELEEKINTPDSIGTLSALNDQSIYQSRYNTQTDSIIKVRERAGLQSGRKFNPEQRKKKQPTQAKAQPIKKIKEGIKPNELNMDSLFAVKLTSNEISNALNNARTMKGSVITVSENQRSQQYEFNVFRIQWHKILANSAACLVMFLIGAPLGSIIKKGGLGIPVLVSILFFILFYVMSLTGEKWAKQETVTVPMGIWGADFILLVFGLIFLRQARLDARLFESDFYQVMLDKFRKRFQKPETAKA